MNKQAFQEFGSYNPSFFHIKINTNKALNNWSNLIKEDPEIFSTLFHEYIHYMQDFLTVYGLLQMDYSFKYIASSINEINKTKSKEFQIPIYLDETNPIHSFIEFNSIFRGETEFDYTFDKIDNIQILENDIILNYEQIPYIKVDVTDNTTKEKRTFDFGAFCIMEGMAYLIEKMQFGEINVPVFPYRIVELICEFYNPNLAKDKKNIIALCDVALNSQQPAFLFVKLLNLITETNFPISNPRDIFRLTRVVDTEFLKHNPKHIKIGNMYSNLISIVKDELKEYFALSPIEYKPIIDWIELIFNNAKKLRLEEHFNFLDFCENPNDAPKLFGKMLDLFGTPIISNNLDYYYISHPTNDSEEFAPLFPALFEIKKLFSGIQTKCSLQIYCHFMKQSNPDWNLDERCETDPWNKNSGGCLYVQMWRLLGLHGKKPIYNF